MLFFSCCLALGRCICTHVARNSTTNDHHDAVHAWLCIEQQINTLVICYYQEFYFGLTLTHAWWSLPGHSLRGYSGREVPCHQHDHKVFVIETVFVCFFLFFNLTKKKQSHNFRQWWNAVLHSSSPPFRLPTTNKRPWIGKFKGVYENSNQTASRNTQTAWMWWKVLVQAKASWSHSNDQTVQSKHRQQPWVVLWNSKKSQHARQGSSHPRKKPPRSVSDQR